MKIYNYHPITREFLNESVADPDPLNKDEWLIPAHATTCGPSITHGINEVLVLNEKGDRWSKVKDFRGSTYWLSDGTKITITDLGEVIPTSALNEEPDLRTLEEIVSESYDLVKANHARVLDDLSGSATTQERDTWPLQKEWALGFTSAPNDHHKGLLEGLLTPGEKAALGDNAAQFMAEKIISKSHAMDLLTSKAGGLKREAEEALNTSNTKDEITDVMTSLEQKMQITIQEFLQAVSNG